MYKLFLTFRYLTRKKIVIFPVLVVWLCVMMLIIVTSIMGGFVERVRTANHDLFGDIIISSGGSTRGWSGYEELRDALAARFPEIRASTPSISAYALLYVPEYRQTRPALLVGVRPEERSEVTQFRESLYLQYRAPMQAADDLSPRLPATQQELEAFAESRLKAAAGELTQAYDDWFALEREDMKAPLVARPDFRWAWGFVAVGLVTALALWRARKKRSVPAYIGVVALLLVLSGGVVMCISWPVIFPRTLSLAEDRKERADAAQTRAQRTYDYACNMAAGRYESRDALIAALVPAHPSFDVPPAIAQDPNSPHDGCIVGSRIGFFTPDKRGNFNHPAEPEHQKVIMTVFPVNQKTGSLNVSAENANQHAFTLVDDSHTGVYDIDSLNVYAPFEQAQLLAGLRADPALVKTDPTADFAPMCQELLIRLKNPGNVRETRDLSLRIRRFVDAFQTAHPVMYDRPLIVETWDEKQKKYLGAVQNEKVMMTFILLLMSGVVVVVIFLIFYQIVRDKTRDIGIIKAVGGSEEGVAGIFLSYGLFVGVVGGGLGVLSGVLFVTHTNQIHEWIYQMTGIIIWDRTVYLFDRIPDQVYSSDVVTYFLVALVAGVIGALIPAVLAGAEDPVQAVRYE